METGKYKLLLAMALWQRGSISSLYSSPNSWTMSFSGSTGTFSLSGNAGACVMTVPISVTYPSASSMSITASGAYSCLPANCSAGCGTNSSIAYRYTFSVVGTSATLKNQDNFDPVCSSATPAQSNPVQYSLLKQ